MSMSNTLAITIVFAGEAIFNIAGYEAIDQVAENIDAYNDELDPNTDEMLSDEPPLVWAIALADSNFAS